MNTSIVLDKEIDATSILKEPSFILLDTRISYIYVDGKPTSEVAGIRYWVVNTETFDKISVMVNKKIPVISEEELEIRRNRSEKVFIEFINLRVKVYFNPRISGYSDSFRADDIILRDATDWMIDLSAKTE